MLLGIKNNMGKILEERLKDKLQEYSNLDSSLYELLAEESKDWAIEIIAAAMLEECVCKNVDPKVECYFCQIRNKLLNKLEELG